MNGSRRKDQPGQILVLFVLALVAMIGMLGLLLDGGQALALRRQLQNAGDAAALAGANVIVATGATAGCSATAGPPPGAPRAAVVDAARAAVHASMPSIPNSSIDVTCPGGWGGNNVVQVNVANSSPGYFAGIFGMHGFAVATTSQAINGKPPGGTRYNVVLLDPSHPHSTPSWPTGFRGCSSLLFSGSNYITFDGFVQVNSSCSTADGGATSGNGGAATVVINNGASIDMVGGYLPGALSINPTPLTGQDPIKDPLSWLPPVPYGAWPTSGVNSLVRSPVRLKLGSGATILKPGIYVGGIEMGSSAVAYLEPGIYVMKTATNGDGGFALGSQNAAYSIPKGMTSTSDATWNSDCTSSNCGVLIYNTGMTSNAMSGPAKDTITVGAGATLKLRPYKWSVDTYTAGPDDSYDNLLFWQDADQAPGPNYRQPDVSLSGGGLIDLTGTLYAPSAKVQMGGTSGGAGGAVDVTLQFICWDLSFNGNIGFHFYYASDAFTKPQVYGLIK
jgi:Flp pilus assembly protein TadG